MSSSAPATGIAAAPRWRIWRPAGWRRTPCDSISTIMGASPRPPAGSGPKHGRLDILVNNAGIFDFADGPPGSASIEAVRRVLEVNFIGALAVTQAMLPLLRAAPAGRIVNLSSSLGSLTLNGDPDSPYYAQRYIGYNASKAALG
jgi:NAD(P)-dependent dehydrogenase (short-subunit alcohol dehydrogenase family)